MESTYDVFASADGSATWPGFLVSRKRKALKQVEVTGSQAGEQSKR